MPDWSYHPLLRPLHARLPARLRRASLEFLGAMGRRDATGRFISFVGDARPAPGLRRQAFGLSFPAPVGTGADLAANAALLPFCARLGVGFVELGPVSLAGGETQVDAEEATRRLAGLRGRLGVPVGARLAHRPGADAAEAAQERRRLVARLAPAVDFLALAPPPPAWSDEDWRGHVAAVAQAAREAERPLLAGVDASDGRLAGRVADALAAGAAGIVLLRASPEAVRRVREAAAPDTPLLASGGVEEPADALALLEAGATLVALDDGLARAGPSLPKRIHEALRHKHDAPKPAGSAWTGMALLGWGMILCGALVGAVAATSVILPYDEAAIGMGRAQLDALNPRLLPFLTHDRMTLAGTMISIGVLYLLVALHALRAGSAWARRAIAASAAVGFASFFLYLAFGYFDPLHALAALALLPFFLLGLRGRADAPPRVPTPDLRNDRAWRLAQPGQLGFIVLSAGLILAGVGIAIIGSTRVFVASDLEFLGTSAQALREANPALLPMVAHDRAGFGGALVADGIAALLLSLWGIRRGARWVWWTLLASGAAGFGAALGVHAAVGYVHALHLAPALLALAIFAASLALLHSYLCDDAPRPGATEAGRAPG